MLLGAVAARVLARFKPNSTWLVLGSAGAGLRSIVLARSESDVLGYLRARDRQDRPRASLVRRLPAPREREPGCLAVRALAEARADSPRELAEAWVLLHDRVAVALWAATFHVEHTTLDAARGKASLLSLPEEATKSALLRRAAVRPADVLGAGLVAALVVDGEQARVDRARAAVAFGDASVATMRAHLAAVRSPGAAR